MKRSLLRLLNLSLITLSYLISLLARKPVVWGTPAAATIEPTNRCNLRCPECPSGTGELTRPKGIITEDTFQKAITRLSPNLSYLSLYFQGEPFLHPGLDKMIAFARSLDIHVACSTNGHFLDEVSVEKLLDSGLNRLIISLDGHDSETYSAYRQGGDFLRVLEGARLLCSEKKRRGLRSPVIILQCIVLSTNENYLDTIKALGRELGVDKVEFKTAQFYHFQSGNPLMPANPGYTRYTRGSHRRSARETSDSDALTIKNPLRNACFRLWSNCTVTWEGRVVACCYDKDGHHTMGDIMNQNLYEIWRGEKFMNLRSRILNHRAGIAICKNCDQQW